MWGKFPSGGPPPPPPVWEVPIIKKKLGLFFILEPQEHLIFGLHQKITILNKLIRHQ